LALKSKLVQKFKETEVGRIPIDWKVKKIEMLFHVSAGGDLSKISFSKNKSAEYEFSIFSNSLNNKGLYGFSKEYQYKPECITITARGNVGRSVCRKEPFNAIVRLLVLKPKQELSCYFIAEFINSRLDFSYVGAAVNQLTGPMISERMVAFPPPQEQKRIAKIISDLDLKIEVLQSQNKVLEEIAQTVFKSWFVDFDEIIKFDDSEVGRIPKKWKVVKIEDVIELLYGKSLTKTNRTKGNIPVYGSSGIIGFHDEYLCSSSGIVVGRKGHVGSVFWSQNPFYVIDTAYYVKTELPLQYVYRNLQNQNFIDSDGAVPGLSRKQAYSLPILIPDESSLERFENFASKIQILIEKNNQSISSLKQMLDILLPKLMSGEIRI
jgi:type I restriction enzyme, S subunit